MIETYLIVPFIIAFIITGVLTPAMIPFLSRLKFGQFVRHDGPQSHLKKSGTPTMGGISFVLGIAITAAIYSADYPQIRPILFMTLGFGVIGFLDDYVKVVKKRSLGLRAYQKIVAQLVVSLVYLIYMLRFGQLDTGIMMPFTDGFYLELGFWFIPFMLIVILGTVNGTNLTDGLDGLATTVTVLVAGFFTIATVFLSIPLAPITSAVVGSLMAFLLFNAHPASIFMGDTGSLAIGGFVVSTAIALKMPLFIIIVGFVYLAECISVILQVGYFKMTGKRIFKMAPIHHHFELVGWKETKVVAVFSIITGVLCVIGLYALNGFVVK